MSRVCFITGAKTMFGHNVSHSKIKTNRLFKVNIQYKTLKSDILNKEFPVKISTKGLRTIYKHGTLDAFLLKRKKKLQSSSVSVTKIINDVKRNGDKALLKYEKKFNKNKIILQQLSR